MLKKLRYMDWFIIFLTFLFMLISTFAVKSATHGHPMFVGYETKTLMFYGVGFLAMIAISFLNYRYFLKAWPYLYGVGIVLLILVIQFGTAINGAKSWFSLPGGLLFQPAEFIKLALVLSLAGLMKSQQGAPLEFVKHILPLGTIVLIPFVLVLIQPDLGNAVIYLFILIGMLWIGNLKYSQVFIGLLIVAAGLCLTVFLFNAFNTEIEKYLVDHQKRHWYARINTFIHPEKANDNDLYQSQKALIAIGSGGLTGDGYLEGRLKNNRMIPYAYSDSIFVVIGEEFGFLGASLLILLYFLLIYRMILIAFQCIDYAGAYMIVGIVSMWVFQVYENIGMMIGLMPITGITLPFVSYGGTSLILNMVCVGLVLNVKMHQPRDQGLQFTEKG